MEKAKAAVSEFMAKAGHHDTTVHEKVAPAVTNETVSQHRHEENTTAIDREVHQHHYHTSVQPVQHQEVLPEKHHHNLLPVEHREHHHGNDADVKARLEREAAQFRDTQVKGDTRHTSSTVPTIAGEHIHHHVHETIQPVVQKETIQPSVIHTTVPIHEVHHNEAKHHATSALPAVSMADFKKQGGVLSGRDERVDGFEGEPRAVGSALGGGSGSTGTHHGLGHHNNNTGSTDVSGNTTGTKPSLGDRMNPRVDADGDGKRGFMN